jgi:hypothetical protein
MSVKKPITKENIDDYLKAVAKEYRKESGKRPTEIIIIGGASILINYGFREMTYDIDAVITTSDAMKRAISTVGDRLGLQGNWLNADFKNTNSYSDRLSVVSKYHRTFSNVLEVRTVGAEYLIAMKLMSGRQYKNDMSDILGILSEHQKSNNAITPNMVDSAVTTLYGGWDGVSAYSKSHIDKAFENGDYETLYSQVRESEIESEEILVDFEQSCPAGLKAENIDTILKQARTKQGGKETPNYMARFNSSDDLYIASLPTQKECDNDLEVH